MNSQRDSRTDTQLNLWFHAAPLDILDTLDTLDDEDDEDDGEDVSGQDDDTVVFDSDGDDDLYCESSGVVTFNFDAKRMRTSHLCFPCMM